MRPNYQPHDYFVGKIAPFLLFEMEFHSLYYVVQNHKEDKFYPENNPASQVATIGLLAYFESFCKHQFAAIVNIMPTLLLSFAQKRDEPKIEFSTIFSFVGDIKRNLGFLLAEKYDFGTVKSINGIFRDLLNITIFNKKEEKLFNQTLHKRNLLVHHAGYFTLQSLKGKVSSTQFKRIPFKEAIKIDTEDYNTISDFLFEMALKIARQTNEAIRTDPSYKDLGGKKTDAIKQMMQGLYDNL